MPADGQHSDDSRLASALREFQDAIDAGRPLDRSAFLACHPAVAHELHDCLDSLLLIRDLVAPVSDTPVPGLPIGDFRLLREVGRGGMGVVYEAEQLSLGRRVALKVLPFAATLDARRLQRFRTEAAAAAHLRHPHVVAVHGVGCERGIHYYAMQFVDGPSLSDVLRRLRSLAEDDSPPGQGVATRAGLTTLPAADSRDYYCTVARWTADAANALDHAHQFGIVHRDVKPGNLLLDADGTLYVADFGLAQVNGDGGITRTGDMIGTLRYMPPEQVRGDRALDPRGDVYSLGATLYELLTLQPAFPALERPALLRQVLDEEAAPVRRIRPAVPAELAIIAQKAMAKFPPDRYSSAKALADDLRAWLDDRPIRARPPTLVQRAGRLGRRYRGAAVAAAIGLAVTATVLAISTVWVAAKNVEANAALAQRNDALAESKRLQQETATALRHATAAKADLARALERETVAAYSSSVALADRASRDGDVVRATRLLAACPAERRGWEWHYLNHRLQRPHFSAAESGVLNRLRFTNDGRSILAVAPAGQRRSATALRWAIDGSQPTVRFTPPNDSGRDIIMSCDGRLAAVFDQALLSESPRSEVRLFDSESSHEIARIRGPEAGIGAVAFSPQVDRIAIVGLDGSVSTWSVGSDTATWTAQADGPGLDVAFAPNGNELAIVSVAASEDRTEVRLYDVRDGRLIRTTAGANREAFHETTRQLAYSPDGSYLIVPVGVTAQPIVVRTADGHPARLPRDAAVRAFTPSGQSAIALMSDGSAAIITLATGRVSARLPLRQPREIATDSWTLNRTRCPVAVSPNGRVVAVGLDDGRLSIWSLDSGREIASLPRGNKPNDIAFSPDSSKLAVAAIDSGVKVWDLALVGEARELVAGGPGRSVARLTRSPSGNIVAALTASPDRALELAVWDATNGRELLRRSAAAFGAGWAGPTPGSLVISADGRQIAASGYVRLMLPGESRYARGTVVWGLDDTLLRIRHDPLTCEETLGVTRGDACFAQYDSTGRLTTILVPRTLRNQAGTPLLRLLDAETDELLWQLPVAPVTSSSASANAGRIALAFAGPTASIQVWDTAAHQMLWQLALSNGNRLNVTLSRDGRYLLTVPSKPIVSDSCPIWEQRAVVWNATTGQTLCALDAPAVPGAWGSRITSSFAFSDDGRRLASYGGVAGLKIWDAATGYELLTLGDDGPIVIEAVFTADGLLVAADESGAVRIWDGRAILR
ncbi:MAG: serine/threonine-protein kinase [Gemmataceae bacterium]